MNINTKHKAVKLLEKNIEEHLYNFGVGKYLLHGTQKALIIKEKFDKLDFIKT